MLAGSVYNVYTRDQARGTRAFRHVMTDVHELSNKRNMRRSTFVERTCVRYTGNGIRAYPARAGSRAASSALLNSADTVLRSSEEASRLFFLSRGSRLLEVTLSFTFYFEYGVFSCMHIAQASGQALLMPSTECFSHNM